MSSAVLVVDDDVNAQIIATTLLRLRGLEVRVTADAADAYDIVEREDIGVVLVDLSTPGVNGLGLLRRLRDGSGAQATPPRIIVMTDRQAPEVERFAQRIGADAVLRKPMVPSQFIATVERLMPAVLQPATQASGG